jgi:hypothetical protein
MPVSDMRGGVCMTGKELRMTGKELIMYILQNDLENTIVFEDGFFVGFMTEKEAAAKFNVGVATIRAWYNCKWIQGTMIGGSLYFRKDVADPRGNIKMES